MKVVPILEVLFAIPSKGRSASAFGGASTYIVYGFDDVNEKCGVSWQDSPYANFSFSDFKQCSCLHRRGL